MPNQNSTRYKLTADATLLIHLSAELVEISKPMIAVAPITTKITNNRALSSSLSGVSAAKITTISGNIV